MKSLPLVTMEKIAELSQQTARETSAFIQQTYEQMKTSHTIKSSLSSGQWHCFTQKEVPLFEETFYQTSTYPKTKKPKKNCLANVSLIVRNRVG